MKDQSSLLQVHMYREFLRSEGIDIEDVIAWFFTDYLKDEFGAEHLRFRPSSGSATYLEKCRHLFSEMKTCSSSSGSTWRTANSTWTCCL